MKKGKDRQTHGGRWTEREGEENNRRENHIWEWIKESSRMKTKIIKLPLLVKLLIKMLRIYSYI